uniref:TIGR04222 domain-containing membrane protein n=1 Tax=Bradyrhizobium sp. (strain ORS 278) TaxID=114615 RepID=UPI0002FEDD83|nr:TIGR04222 domain-containing membrane protein [Bradyrhizobium sp. ORS 278]
MALNPFNWTAGPFLLLYVASAVIVFALVIVARRMIGPPATSIRALRELELAYLAGGEQRLGDAVLLGLAAKNAATFTPRNHRITIADQAPLAALIDRPPPLKLQPEMTRQQFQTALGPLAERIRQRLQSLGYAPSEAQLATFRTAALGLIGALLMLGVVKVVVGTERHHPVGFLLILLVATCVLTFVLMKRPTRTRAGHAALQDYKAVHARAARAPREHELLMAVALSGAVVLSGTAYASVLATSQTLGGGSTGGGCGGGGDGGGGGGCGGCS